MPTSKSSSSTSSSCVSLINTTPAPVSLGGTGATTEAGARTSLGLAIGSDVQAYNTQLANIAGMDGAVTDGGIIVGDGNTHSETIIRLLCRVYGKTYAFIV